MIRFPSRAGSQRRPAGPSIRICTSYFLSSRPRELAVRLTDPACLPSSAAIFDVPTPCFASLSSFCNSESVHSLGFGVLIIALTVIRRPTITNVELLISPLLRVGCEPTRMLIWPAAITQTGEAKVAGRKEKPTSVLIKPAQRRPFSTGVA